MSARTIDKLGGYTVIARLKSGGMGDVLLARRAGAHGFEKLFALKTILPNLSDSENIRAMFLDEARLVARLHHPSIAQVFDFGEAEGVLFLAMEYVAGVSFAELRKRQPAFVPPAVVARLVAECCRGLHAAHELAGADGVRLGVVHRDVSPQNLMLTFDGHVKVLDFGIALSRTREAAVTHVGEVRGKPAYMSPEQLQGHRVDRRTDLYAMGVVAHELLTGAYLFDYANPFETARAVLERRGVQPPSQRAGPLPPGLDEAVMTAMESDAERRFQDAREMADVFERIATEAGAESAQAFADRTLSQERETKQRELAEVSGQEPTLTPSGNKDSRRTQSDLEAPSPTTPMRPQKPESIALLPTAPSKLALRRRRALWGGVAFLFFVGVGGGTYLQATSRTPALVGPPAEARAEPPPIVSPPAEPPPVQEERVAEPADPPPEPVVPVAAPPAQKKGHDKHPRVVTATVAPAVARGTTRVTFAADPYALIRLDGKSFGVTPLIDAEVEAGPHVIELIAPDTGEVRLMKSVELEAGKPAVFRAP